MTMDLLVLLLEHRNYHNEAEDEPNNHGFPRKRITATRS